MRIESEQETDGRWLAEAPELPGVMAYGASQIAATAVQNHLPLCTANVKHFRSISDLEVHPFKP